MKNLFLGLVATVLLSGVAVNAQKIIDMDKDPDFIQYVKNSDEFMARATQKDLVKKIYSDKKVTENELPDLYRIFGTDQAGYTAHIKKQRALLQILDTKYQISDPKNEDLIAIEIGEQYATSSKLCERRYRNASIKIAALSVVGHSACLALDVSVIGGILCHAAVTAWGLAAADDAWLDYRQCLSDSK